MGVLIGGTILYMVRRNHLHVPYTIWWVIVAVAAIFLGLFPRIVDSIASRLGVHYPPILLVAVALGLLLVKLLAMDIERTRQELKIRRLIQRVALLEAEKGEPEDKKVKE